MEGSAEDGMKGMEVLRSSGLPSKVLDQVDKHDLRNIVYFHIMCRLRWRTGYGQCGTTLSQTERTALQRCKVFHMVEGTSTNFILGG